MPASVSPLATRPASRANRAKAAPKPRGLVAKTTKPRIAERKVLTNQRAAARAAANKRDSAGSTGQSAHFCSFFAQLHTTLTFGLLMPHTRCFFVFFPVVAPKQSTPTLAQIAAKNAAANEASAAVVEAPTVLPLDE